MIGEVLAARQVGPTGNVIGVDMTRAMIDKARTTPKGWGLHNVEFIHTEIEELTYSGLDNERWGTSVDLVGTWVYVGAPGSNPNTHISSH